MVKVDYKKEFKNLYKVSSKQCTVVEVPDMNYLMIDGEGNPNNSEEFKEAVEALYGVSYALKFMSKKMGKDYVVMPLEGLWYMDDMSKFSMNNKDEWKWTIMIMQPQHITKEMAEDSIQAVKKKKKSPALPKLRFEKYGTGLAAQILHIGPYDDEPCTIEKLHNFIKENGFKLCGKHQEIYLSDARKTAPEKLKTIIRQPVKKPY